MEEQDKLLETASAVVREQAFFMKKAIEQENLRDALKYSSNMISELRTSQLSPRFYYELYMLVFQELQHLAAFFGDKSRHGRKLTELYESVQHAGSILPRLYLLVTVGVAYIQSQEAPGVEILRDMAELCKGVQHPIRGLFLRYYLLQMTKDKLQAVAAESPTGLEDVVDFILSNFNETTRLWIRLSAQSPAGQRDRAKRERERHDLRILVGASLVRLSQLEGMTRALYTDKVLPRILEQAIGCKDALAQQYLLDCTVQVFPDDFHLESLSVLLSACSQTQRQVDLRPVLINLMNRLRSFLVTAKLEHPPDVFGLFRLHLERIMHRTDAAKSGEEEDDGSGEKAIAPITAQAVDSPFVVASKACGNMLELFQAFLGFTISLDAKKFDQVSIVHGMALAALDKYMQAVANLASSAEDRADEDDEPAWLGPLIEIVETTAKSVPMSVALSLSQFGSLLAAVPKKFSKKVSIAMIDAILDEEEPPQPISDAATLSRFLTVIESLLYDNAVTEGSTIEAEQVKVCKMVHVFYSQDVEEQYELLTTLRSYFGRGGPQRLKLTLPTLISCAIQLASRVHAAPKGVTVKKVFQFVHNTCLALVPVAPELAFRQLLAAARLADHLDATLEPIAHEFYTQALICFEEELTDSRTQVGAITGLVGALVASEHLAAENYEALATKTTQHAARLLKKIDQCRAVLACCHLFHSKTVSDPKRVLECLQRGLKIADMCAQAQTAAAHELFVECLNAYIYFYEEGLEEIAPAHISNLIALCREHAKFAAENPLAINAKATDDDPLRHLNQTVAYLREKAKEEGSKLGLIRDATADRKENVQPAAPKVATSETHE